ncbi:sugar ABC transporter permease [Cohnella sp. CIP 111063]|uniref:carbohydrate ABC transporter permease n=1 Tax=unclassified Cohnella TaxID=2636738 RepID=UPI000B8C576D|nr:MULTISPECIES: carbohydrate ABC transporter permease [unclassified Cohnella]OXS55243.1 sugar ABC transporter permease [Cohnella sp. CIP 111063]PRX65666.1 putative aldouronate transport system permease protein [Cohnella sp. SGD-V74]
MMKLTASDRVFNLANGILMLLLVVITLYPFYHVVMASLSDSNRLIAHQGLLLNPLGFSWDAYARVLDNPNIFSGYRNTFIILIVGTLTNLFFTALGAYGLSRKFLLRKPIMIAIIFTMYFSGGLIPTYLLVNNWLHMGNSLLALIVPVAISTWNLIIMRTSFEALPESLIESAKIDGAGEFGILFRIVIPLSMPVVAVMILYYGVAHWNSWFNAMLFLRNRELFPLQLILREILVLNDTSSMQLGDAMADQEGVRESIKYATIMVATVPILLIYPFLQRFFAKGVMIGAVKE